MPLLPPIEELLGEAPGSQPSQRFLPPIDELIGPQPTGNIKQPARTVVGTLGDVAATAANAAIGAGEAVVGLADIPTLGRAGKFMQNVVGYDPKAARAVISDTLGSDAQKWANQQFERADGWRESLSAVASNPSVAIKAAAESVPTMFLGGGIAKVASGAKALSRLSPAAKSWVMPALGEGAVSAGSAAEQIRQESQTGDLSLGQTAIALGSGAAVAGIGGASGKLARKLGFETSEQAAYRVASGATADQASRPMLARMAGGAASEGILQEAPQSAVEQMAQNWATDRPIGEGVEKQTVLGAAAGSIMGAGANIRRSQEPSQPSQPEPKLTPSLAQQAFADVGGSGAIIEEQAKARSVIIASLANMNDEEAARSIQTMSAGDQGLAATLESARTDTNTVAESRRVLSDGRGGWEAFLVASNLIRREAGLLDTTQGQPTIAEISGLLGDHFKALRFGDQPATVASAQQTQPGVASTQQSQPGVVPAQQPPVNQSGFVPEPPSQLQAQVDAVRQGRKPIAVMAPEESAAVNVDGLAPGVATGPDGRQLFVVAPSNEAVVAFVDRAAEVGVEQAAGEFLGYVQPGINAAPDGTTAVVQQIDQASGQVLQEEAVTPDQAPNVSVIPGTTKRILPVQQALAERAQRSAAESVPAGNTQTLFLAPQEASESSGYERTAAPPAVSTSAAQAAEPTVVDSPATAVSDLVSKLNRQNALSGDEEIDPASIRQVSIESIRDKRAQRRASQLTKAVKQAFGVDLILVDSPSGGMTRRNGKQFNRFYGMADPGSKRVYISVRAATPTATMAHELAHVMERDAPDLYAKVEEAILARVQLPAYLRLKTGLINAIEAESRGSADADRMMSELRSELVAEAIGEMGADQQLWSDIFTSIGNDSDSKRLYDLVVGVISKMVRGLQSAGYVEGIADIKAVRKAVTDAFVDWSAGNATAPATEKPPAVKPQTAPEAVAPTVDDTKRREGESDKEFAKRVIDKRPKPKSMPENHGSYFNLPAGTQIVSIEKISSTKSDKENEQGAENGVKRMAAAAAGEIAKRDPITVMPSKTKPGEFDIVDGNGTFSSLKPYGWKTMPVTVVDRTKGERAIKIDKAKTLAEKHLPKALVKEVVDIVEQFSDIADDPAFLEKKADAEAFMTPIMEKAAEANDGYQEKVAAIAKDLGAKHKPGPLKKMARSTYKLWEDSWHIGKDPDAGMVKDLVRASIVVESEAEVQAAVEAAKRSLDVIRLKDRFQKPLPTGYRDILINVRLENGTIAELQIHIPEIYDVKELGHIAYEAERRMAKGSDAQVAIEKLQERYYGAAYGLASGRAPRAATSASNSSAVALAPFSTTLENRKSLPETASLNQRSSNEPTTGTPSTSSSQTPGLLASRRQSNFTASDISNTSEDSVLHKGSPTYISRPVTNAGGLHAWAVSNGIKDVVPAGKMHVTLAYSKAPVDRNAVGSKAGNVIVSPDGRSLEIFDDGTVVLRIDSDELQSRWRELIDAGATWDFGHYDGAYKPHITLSYEKQDIDLGKIKPYSGSLTLGPEKAEDLKTGFSEEVKAEIDGGPALMSRAALDAAMRGEKISPQAMVETTPAILVKHGLRAGLPIAIEGSVIRKVLEGKLDIEGERQRPPLTRAQLLELGDLLQNPAAIFESASRGDSIVVMTNMLDSAGDPVVVAIQKNDTREYQGVNKFTGQPRREYLTANFVNSAYGKSNIDGLEAWLKSGRMLHWDKTQTQNSGKFPLKVHLLLTKYRNQRGQVIEARKRGQAVVAPGRDAGPIPAAARQAPQRPDNVSVSVGSVGVNSATGRTIIGVKKPKVLAQRAQLSTVDLMRATDAKARASLGLNPAPTGKDGNLARDIAQALNRRTIFSVGIMDDENTSQGAADRLAEAMADEVRYQLSTTSATGTGLGWYSNNYPRALDRLSTRFPELRTDRRARAIFTAFVAITSNGEKVNKNISNAIKLYARFRVGKTTKAVGNRRLTALQNNLVAIDSLVSRFGIDGFEAALMQEITVGEMNAELRALGEKPDTSYTANTIMPRAAVYFGPKLGAFYANLMGSEGYLTMDLWWSRTINRMRGLLIPKATDISVFNFKQLIDQPGLSRDEAVDATIEPRNIYEEHGFITQLEFLVGSKEPKKSELERWMAKARSAAGEAFEAMLLEHKTEKLANTIYKNEFEMLEEAPFRATDRAFMYRAARKAQQLLADTGTNLSLADIQAALWYYEKRLYQKLSGRKADDIGYEEALISHARKGRGPARPATRFDRVAGDGAQPGGANQEADRLLRGGRGAEAADPGAGQRSEVLAQRTQEQLSNDGVQQEQWLDSKAKELGFDDLDDMASKDMDAVIDLAVQWRSEHPVDDESTVLAQRQSIWYDNRGTFDANDADIRHSRPLKAASVQEALDMARTGRPRYRLRDAIDRGLWADAFMRAKSKAERTALINSTLDKVIEKFGDSLIPVRRWIEKLPLSASLKQSMDGDLYRAATTRAVMQKEVKQSFLEPMFRAIESASKKTGLSSDQIKMLSGMWMTARYAPKANAWLITKDRIALQAAQASRDPEAIAKAQANLNDRLSDVGGAIGAAKKRGVAGGYNNAEAARIVADVETKIDRQLLDEISRPIYEMMAWKKARDLSSGKVNQMMVNSWPSHKDYVPLTGDPRFDPDSDDIFSAGNQLNQDKDHALNGRKDSVADDGIDAAVTAVLKSINFAAIQPFKRRLAQAYDSAKAAGVDIGLTRQPVTGITRLGDDVVIYRDSVTSANGLVQTRVDAIKFADKSVIEALKRENVDSVGWFMNEVVGAFTRGYGRMVTQFMPMFAPINLIRDMWERSEFVRTRTILDTKGNKVNTDQVARRAIMGVIDPQLWKASFDYNVGRQSTSQEYLDLKEFLDLGGSSMVGDYLSRTSASLEDELRRSYGKVAGTWRKTEKLVEAYNGTFEMLSPLAIYRGLKAKGVSKEDAAAAVLDLMNFRKKGSAMGAVKALYVFSQPAATSGYNLMRYLSTTKGQVRFAAQLAVGMALYGMLRGLWGDEDDEELGNRLDNLSNYTVGRTIPIKVGDMIVKIPVGFGPAQLAWNGAGIIDRWLSGRYKTTDALAEAAVAWHKSMSPVNPSEVEFSRNPAGWLAQTFTPTILQPVQRIAMNQNAFGSQLRPSFLDPSKLNIEQARRTTPKIYSDIAREIYDLTGVDMFPDNVKAVLDGYVVGPAREVVSALIDNPAKEMRGEPVRVPVFASVADNINDRQILNSIWMRHRKDLEGTAKEYEIRVREGRLAEWLTPERMKMVGEYKRMESIERKLGAIRGALTKVADRIPEEQLSAQTKAIEAVADQTKREAIKAMR